MNDIPNLNCYGSIEMSFILFKSSKERLFRPFLIFYLIELQKQKVRNSVRDTKILYKTNQNSSIKTTAFGYRLRVV